jgi:hypothetical protein
MRREWARFCSDRCRVAHSELDKAIKVVNRYLATVNEAASIAGIKREHYQKVGGKRWDQSKEPCGKDLHLQSLPSKQVSMMQIESHYVSEGFNLRKNPERAI